MQLTPTTPLLHAPVSPVPPTSEKLQTAVQTTTTMPLARIATPLLPHKTDASTPVSVSPIRSQLDYTYTSESTAKNTVNVKKQQILAPYDHSYAASIPTSRHSHHAAQKVKPKTSAPVKSLCVVMSGRDDNLLPQTIAKALSLHTGTLTKRKHGYVSYLMDKDFSHMKSFNWDYLLQEILDKAPYFAKFAVAIMLHPDEWHNAVKLEGLKYRLCMAYAILMQGRMRELSLVQRIVSMIFMDNICDEKVGISL
jgi:hypothetical protein